MYLVTGHGEHKKALLDLISKSVELYIAVAFLKSTGLGIIEEILLKQIKQTENTVIICGLDFGLTDPEALKQLFKISEQYKKVKIYLASGNSITTAFHPKIYFSKKGSDAFLLLGSANLTSGGLVNNEECSVFVKAEHDNVIYKQTLKYFENLINKPNIRPASLMLIKRYETFFKDQIKLKREVDQQSFIDLSLPESVYKELKTLYKKFKKDDDLNGENEKRRKEYQEAKQILNIIADDPKLSRIEFIQYFEKLVGAKGVKSLWHSGSIFRKKTTVFNHRKRFSELVKFIRTNQHKAPSVVFEGAKSLVEGIEGSGINTVTEIMMTYNYNDYANLNKNPLKVLREKVKLDIKQHRNSYKGVDYEEYCNIIKEINNILGIRDMLETDSFFNTIFWRLE